MIRMDISGPQHIHPDDWRALQLQAWQAYPHECCGVFLKKAIADPFPLEWHPCHNIQSRLHAFHPASYPRSARHAYVLDPLEWRSIQRRVELEEARLAVLYHSHIDAPAYFSEEDTRAALWGGEPLFPETLYLVLSVQRGRVDHWKGFLWDADTRRFQPRITSASEASRSA